MENVTFASGEFTDFLGDTRKFVLAAVSLPVTDTEIFEENLDLECKKVLSLGIAVCRAGDEFNEDLGMKIAEGKARKYRNHALYATDAGLINETLVDALLDQEMEYFQLNPGRYITGYDKSKAKYLEEQRIEDIRDNMDDDARIAADYLLSASDQELRDLFDVVAHEDLSE